MSIRRDIRTNIITVLSGITKVGGYNFDVAAVQRKLVGFENVDPGNVPILFVVNEDEKKVDADVDDLISNLQVNVIGYVHNREDTTDDIDKLIEDIEKAVCLDRFRGNEARVVNTLPSDIKTDKGTLAPWGIVEFTFIITYHQLYGTP